MKDDRVEITLSAKMREDQYVAFGLSGAQNRPQMVGGDVTVAYFDKDSMAFKAIDYYMSHTAQCDGKNGVCPDERIGGRNDVILLAGDRKNGITTIKYSRPLQTNEAVNDRPIPTQGEVNVIAAFGPLNSRKEANAHSMTDKTLDDVRIDFGQLDDHDCTISLDELMEDTGPKPWPPAKLIGDNSFTVRIGPTGGKRGYTPITGIPSWGICWYINDMLIPEVTVERGQTYTFMIEGGDDETNPARYHPFYITDSPEGGFGQRNEEEQKNQKVFAGVGYDHEGYPYPTAFGRYCEWAHISVDKSLESTTFKEYKKTLRLECDRGEPGYLNWTVPFEAPDLLYYQCYTHNNLGWKIHVVDPGTISEHTGKINGTTSKSMPYVALIVVCLLTISALTIHARGRIL